MGRSVKAPRPLFFADLVPILAGTVEVCMLANRNKYWARGNGDPHRNWLYRARDGEPVFGSRSLFWRDRDLFFGDEVQRALRGSGTRNPADRRLRHRSVVVSAFLLSVCCANIARLESLASPIGPVTSRCEQDAFCPRSANSRTRQLLLAEIQSELKVLALGASLLADRPGTKNVYLADAVSIADHLREVRSVVGADWLMISDPDGKVLGCSESASAPARSSIPSWPCGLWNYSRASGRPPPNRRLHLQSVEGPVRRGLGADPGVRAHQVCFRSLPHHSKSGESAQGLRYPA